MFPRSKQEMIEELDQWVLELNDRDEDVIIIVEGKKDIGSLEMIGVQCRMIHMNKGLSVLTYLESIKDGVRPFEELGHFDTIIILTDWDRTGGRLAHKLKDACQNLGIAYDTYPRKQLARLTGKWVRDVESLDSLMG
jgi:5S rRNA maturation endonuclease (ribonuclease M5)